MRKPIDIAILRGPQFYAFSDCYLDTVERRLFKKKKRLDVTPRALEVLQVLIENAGEVVSKDELLEQIWGESFVEESNLAVQVSTLRRILGATKDEPYIVAESGVGYRFVSKVKMVNDDEWADIIENELSQKKDGKQQFTSIAIMPLINEESDEDIEYLADGITESLINSLSRAPELRVVARNTVFQFKDKEIDIKKLGRRLRVATILTGRIRMVRDNLVIGVELTKVADGSQIWGTQINEPFDDIFEVQDRISREISSELRLQIDGLSKRKEDDHLVDFESYRQTLKGRHYLRKGGADNILKSIECFQQSLSIDPTQKDVYLDLANCQILKHAYDMISVPEFVTETKRLLERAQSLSGNHAGVLCLKGRIAMNIEWDFNAALKRFRESLEIEPNNVSCMCSYASLLTNLGKFSEAMTISRKILRLDPVSVKNQRAVARVLYRSEQFEAARLVLEEALELDPSNYDTLMILSAVNTELKRFAVARKNIAAASEIFEGQETFAVRGYLQARAGNRRKAKEQLAILRKNYVIIPNIYLAYVYSALEETDKAMRYLETSIEKKEMNAVSIRTNPMLANLRQDPHFASLLTSIGL
ncbi:MAG: hypothetical protein HKN33_15165 [Pyrinomonadaceae bacterium]|nr:hypothetical protein [Pyrinomonadaceae bacterium]